MRSGRERHRYAECRIAGIEDSCADTKTFSLESRDRNVLSPEPGQYGMFWLPGVSENPISFSGPNQITVRKVCEEDEPGTSFTERLFSMEAGDEILVRGPYGRPFRIGSREAGDYHDVIIAGGCGAAPLRLLAERLRAAKDKCRNNKTMYVLLGATTSDGLLFEDEYRQFADDVHIYTDDGSSGKEGLVTDGIGEIGIEPSTRIYVCGPERMMAAAAEAATEAEASAENIQISLERYMKCGMGLCGSCECSGYLVCKDGPVFTYEQLGGTDFGQRRRTRSGRFEDI